MAKTKQPVKRVVTDAEYAMGRRARLVAVVMVATVLIWLGLQWVFARDAVTPRVAILFDLLALAAFVWAMVNIYWIWRARQAEKE